MGKKLTKRLPAALMAVALTALSAQFPQVNAVDGEPSAPSALKFTENIEGNTDLSVKANYAGKTWYVVGKDTGEYANSMVLWLIQSLMIWRIH